MPAAVDATACAAEDRSGVTVFLVNPPGNRSGSRSTSSDLGPGFVVRGGEVVKDSQDRRQPDIVNGFADPRRVVRVKIDVPAGNVVTLPALSIAALDCGRQ